MTHVFRIRRRGISLVELAFALLVIGVVLGGLWSAVGKVYSGVELARASKELDQITQAVRTRHSGDTVTANESLSDLAIEPALMRRIKGQLLMFNPWNGLARVYPGHGGQDPEQGVDDTVFSVEFTRVPQAACTDFIMDNGAVNHGLSVVQNVYLGAEKNGTRFCLSQGLYCKPESLGLTKEAVKAACQSASISTVTFTYVAH